MEENTKVAWPGWEIGPVIGKGGFGKVYEIHRQIPGRVEKAALKVLTIPQDPGEIEEMYNSNHTKSEVTEIFREYKDGILREYALMAEMRGCANIVYCDDFRAIQHDDGIGWDIYIKMELLTPLMKHLHGQASEELLRRLGRDLCNALVYCDRHRIVHRDIKPANIFVAPDGSFKLGDFGIARTMERTTRATRIGTEGYMAPEAYFNQPYGPRADIYSLGLVMYELMNDFRRPFEPGLATPLTARARDEAKSRRLQGEPFPKPAHGSEGLKKIVLRACAYHPEARFVSAEQMLEALQNPEAFAMSANTITVSAVHPVPPEHPRPNTAPAPKKQGAGTAVLGILGGVAAVALVAALGVGVVRLLERQEEPVSRLENDLQASDGFIAEYNNGTIIFSDGTQAIITPIQTDAPIAEPPEETEPVWQVRRNVIGSGREHTVYLRPDGTMLATGMNTYGQCNVGSWNNIVMVASGDYHTVALTADGRIITAGYNQEGQCNTGNWIGPFVDIAAGDYHTLALKADGTVLATGMSINNQCNMNLLMSKAGDRKIVAVEAGFQHSVALLEDGTVVAVGSNTYGQCDVEGWTDIVELYAATDHTVGLRSDGTVVATGNNEDGRCNVYGWHDIITLSAGDDFTLGITADGTIVATGRNLEGQCNVNGWPEVVAIGAGSNHSVVLFTDGTLASTGRNTNGQCNVEGWQ